MLRLSIASTTRAVKETQLAVDIGLILPDYWHDKCRVRRDRSQWRLSIS